MANVDTQNNGPIADNPGEQTSNDVFRDSAFPEAHNENSSQEQPQIAPHPAENHSQVAAPVETPVQETPVQNTVTQTNVDNDERRYQYWQSQAAKKNNELEQLKQKVAAQQQQQPVPQGQQPQQMTQEQFEQENTFPPAPEKPKKPRTFNRSDALEDPNSDSARYLDEVDAWHDEMDNYNTLKDEYNVARFQDQLSKMQQKQQQFLGQQSQFAAQEQQYRQAAEYVIANYGATEDDAFGFVKEMSNDKSINMDNLWKLYQMNKGAPAENAQAPAPSPAFQQTQKAQSVPQPMGVMPSQNTAVNNAPVEDSIMNSLIDAHKDKNPWS